MYKTIQEQSVYFFSPQLICRIFDYRDKVLSSLESLPVTSAKLDLWQALKSKIKNLDKVKSLGMQSMYNALLGAIRIYKGLISLANSFSSFQPQFTYTTFFSW